MSMIDAPVSGGPAGAEQATLSIMAGGSDEDFERALPVFRCLGKTIVHMGPSGAGQVTKACNQLTLLMAAEGVAEALTLAAKCGVDPAKVREVMAGGVAASRVLERNVGSEDDRRLVQSAMQSALSPRSPSSPAGPPSKGT